MNAKLFNRATLMMMCAVVLSGMMTGCKENGNNTPDDPQPTKATAAVMNYTFKSTAIFTFTIEYYGNDGTIKTEVLADTTWSKSVTTALPCKLGARFTLSLKDGVDVSTIDKARIEYSYGFLCYAADANGNAVSKAESYSQEDDMTIKGANINDFLAEDNVLASRLYSFDAEGKSTLIVWE